jgi:type I restriction enzyme S subunit
MAPVGSVVLSSRAPIGHLGIAAVPVCTNQGCKTFLPGGEVESEFLYHALKRSVWELQQMGSGATFAEVSKTQLEGFEIPLPPPPEQKRIAAMLNEQMAAVARARKAAEERLAAVNALPAAYLRDAFPGPDQALPKGWRWVKLGEFITETRNGFGRRPLPGELGPIVLRIADVSKGFIDLTNPRYGFMTDSEYEVYRLRPSDLLFIRVNGSADIVGRVALVGSDIGKVVFNDHLIRVRLSDGILPEYLRLFCDGPGARKHMVASASTSAGQLTINRESLDSLEVPVPQPQKQRQMARMLSEQIARVERARNAAEEEMATINALPAALLRRAFAPACAEAALAGRGEL